MPRPQPSDEPEAVAARRRPHRRLFRKYILLFVILVGGSLLANGALEIWFSYEENKAALARVQQEKALAAAARIEGFLDEITRQIGWTARAQWSASVLDQRRIEYLQLLRQAPAVTEVAHFDAAGREELRVSRLSMDMTGSRADFSRDPRFVEARKGKAWYSEVYYRKESEPYISIAIAGSGRDTGVTAAEVNLKFIWDVISRIKVGRGGYAYVVDGRGLLVAHPDIGLVLRKTDLSTLPQVKDALAPLPGALSEALVGTDPRGRTVLTAHARIAPLQWMVFVDLPLSEAQAPLYASAQRTALLMLIGLALAALAGIFLTRRMVVPIEALHSGAGRIGRGELDHRIAVRTGDELEALAEQFNRMTARLQESYAELERRVADRTRELSESLEHQTATSEVLRVISHAPGALRPVFETVLANAVRMCDARFGVLFRYAGGAFHAMEMLDVPAAFAEDLRKGPRRPASGTGLGRLAATRRPFLVTDIIEEQLYKERNPVWVATAELGGVRSFVAVPMLKEDALVGAIAIFRQDVRPFSDKQVELVSDFANQAAIAIENARLLDELRDRTAELARSVEELKALGEVGHAVTSTLDLKTVVETVVGRAVELGEADACALYRYRPKRRELSLWHEAGFDRRYAATLRAGDLGGVETPLGRAVRAQVPVQVGDFEKHPPSPFGEAALLAGYHAMLVIPLVRASRAFGALVLSRRAPGEFSGRSVELLRTFASQSSLAIQNARLFREIEENGRQIEIASQHKSQFLANMSHELRTPLNAILGYSELMQDGLYGELGDKQRGVLERVQANGRHLLGLINDVLDMAKIEAGQLPLAVDFYSVAAIVHSAVAATESLARAKGLTLRTDVAPDLPLGKGDERRLTQVLLNIVGNAIKFTEAGTVTIAAHRDGESFIIAVTDTGPGIPPAEQERIFEEFQQIDNASTRRKGGSGLGLAISKRIAEMHGGTIGVDSVPDQGATFRIHLPIDAASVKEVA